MSEYHTSVLLDESVSALVDSIDGVYADATFGGGGHTAEILSRLSKNGRVLAFDRDEDAIIGYQGSTNNGAPTRIPIKIMISPMIDLWINFGFRFILLSLQSRFQ